MLAVCCFFISVFHIVHFVLITVMGTNMCHTRTTRRTHPSNAGNFLRYFSMANSAFVDLSLKFRPDPSRIGRAVGGRRTNERAGERANERAGGRTGERTGGRANGRANEGAGERTG